MTLNKIKRLLVALVFTLGCLPSMSAADLLPVLEDIAASYMPWHDASFSGKLTSDKLPLSPTVKIYMVKDSLLQISLRAPLVGEVGRMTVSHSEILLVNKMKRLYVRENPESLLELYPGAIADIQSILLARVVVMGRGELTSGMDAEIDVQPLENGNYALVPKVDDDDSRLGYGYIVGPNGRTLDMMANVTGKGSLEMSYSYKDGGMQMDASYRDRRDRVTQAKFDFNSVKWGGKEMPAMKLTNYRQVGFREFMENLR